MVEIKFRAWTGTRIWNGVEAWEDFCFMVYPQGEYVEWKLMQFTGIKDKNGKEIYEGDIIENFAIKDIVIFDKGIFTTKRSKRDQFGVKQSISVHDELEVIGNIYEDLENCSPNLKRESQDG